MPLGASPPVLLLADAYRGPALSVCSLRLDGHGAVSGISHPGLGGRYKRIAESSRAHQTSVRTSVSPKTGAGQREGKAISVEEYVGPEMEIAV